MTTIIHIYLIATMENIAKPVTTGLEHFKENPVLFYPYWDEETMKYSTSLLQNPVVDAETGELREMTKEELYAVGKYSLADNELVENNKIKTVELSEFEFIEDNTVFKGTARYDGRPVFGEAFVAINISQEALAVAPAKTDVTFALDSANA